MLQWTRAGGCPLDGVLGAFLGGHFVIWRSHLVFCQSRRNSWTVGQMMLSRNAALFVELTGKTEMTQHENVTANWIENLAGALEALAPAADPRYYPALGISIVDFLPNTDLTAALEILRGHPILQSALGGTSANQDAFMAVVPNGALRIELRQLVGSLVYLAIKSDGKNAAETMHRFLDDGKNNQLQGYEITIFDGLKLDRRVDVGEGAFIAPFNLMDADFRLLDEHRYVWLEDLLRTLSWESLPDPMLHEILHYRDIKKRREEQGGSSAALVKRLTWGPAVVPANYDGEIVNQPKYAFPVDQSTILSLLTITMRMPMLARSTFESVEKWMEDISYNFNIGSGMRGYPGHDARTDQAEMSQDDGEIFVELIQNWQTYQGKRDALDIALRKLAGSYYRTGIFQSKSADAILDVATALEVLYELDNTEITYKLATRASCLIGTGPEDRFQVFEKVRKFYRVRSGLIHRGSAPPNASLEQARRDGSELVMKTLIELLRRGSPPSNWDKLVIGCTG